MRSVTTSSQKATEKLLRKDKRRAERAGHDPEAEWLLINGFEALLEAALAAGAPPSTLPSIVDFVAVHPMIVAAVEIAEASTTPFSFLMHAKILPNFRSFVPCTGNVVKLNVVGIYAMNLRCLVTDAKQSSLHFHNGVEMRIGDAGGMRTRGAPTYWQHPQVTSRRCTAST